MKRDTKEILKIFTRYAILILIALPGFNLFYYIFSPLTIYPLYLILNSLYDVSIVGNIIFANSLPIEIIGACIAGSAYYFLLILNLTTPRIETKKRISLILFSFAGFYLINILRIIILSIMYVNNSSLFDFSHKLFWYLGSTIFVIGIWFLEIKIFKIKEIPFYSDLRYLYKSQQNSKK